MKVRLQACWMLLLWLASPVIAAADDDDIEYETEYVDSIEGVQLYKVFNDRLYYVRSTASEGNEWFVHSLEDRENDLEILRDIYEGDRSAIPASLNEDDVIIFKDYMYFLAEDNDNGVELWRTDGTSDNTELVIDTTDLDTGETFSGNITDSDPQHLRIFNEQILFFRKPLNSNDNRWQLWSTEGTEDTTSELLSLNDVQMMGGRLISGVTEEYFYFLMQNEDNDNQSFWRTRGLSGESNTEKLYDEQEGTVSELMILNDDVFFIDDETELRVLDGTNRPELIDAINTAPETSKSLHFARVIDDFMLIAIDNGFDGRELWRSNGTEDSTEIIKDIASDNANGVNFPINNSTDTFPIINSTLYFPGEDSRGLELWRTDGSESNTDIVEDLRSGSTASNPRNFYVLDDMLYFVADSSEGNDYLYRTSASDPSNIELIISNIKGGNATSDSTIEEIFAVDQQLYILVSESGDQTGIYKIVEDDGSIDSLQDFFTGGSMSLSILGFLILLFAVRRVKN